jgi:hypothetical protein
VNQYQTVRNAPEYFWGNLAGCVTDVELQRDLLINRYGFQPADIVTLTDGQATRANIETAFLEHLVKQAQAGDVVIFHFRTKRLEQARDITFTNRCLTGRIDSQFTTINLVVLG